MHKVRPTFGQPLVGAGSSTDQPKSPLTVSKAAATPKGNGAGQGSVMIKQVPYNLEVLENLKKNGV